MLEEAAKTVRLVLETGAYHALPHASRDVSVELGCHGEIGRMATDRFTDLSGSEAETSGDQ